MSDRFANYHWLTCLSKPILMLVVVCAPPTLAFSAEESATLRLIDQYPFDRITLDAANDNAVIDVQLLEFPDREVPHPFPTNGTLEIRRLSDPTKLYTLNWSAIAKITLYEHLVLKEASEYINAGKLGEAYTDLEFLHKNYPDLAGLKQATEDYLQRDALASYSENRYDESLAILSALYDVNPQRQGLIKAVEGVSNRLITGLLANEDYNAARAVLDSLGNGFSQLQLSNIATWQKTFSSAAQTKLATARQAIAQQDFATARQAVRRALAILPDLEDAQELLTEIDRLAPQMLVGVAQLSTARRSAPLQEWADQRVSRLLSPTFVELVGVGAEGGEYACRWAHIERDDSGLKMGITLNAQAQQIGITPARMVLQLLHMADSAHENYRADFAEAFHKVEILDGREVSVEWRFPPVKPIVYLQIPLSQLAKQTADAADYRVSTDLPDAVRFEAINEDRFQGPKVIIEQRFENDEAAILALSRGDIEILEDIPPWNYDRMGQIRGIVVSAYRMPTVHVLLGNYDSPIIRRREFRRALCYGIDRQRLLTEVIAGGDSRPGFRVLSAPIPAGITIGDSIGYGYKQQLQPHPYEPRLAAVLNTTARMAVAKKSMSENNSETPEGESDAEKPESKPLLLIHSANSFARTMCQLIKRQLEAIGIPLEVREISLTEDLDSIPWDLRYAELCFEEPLVDAQRLFGPKGLAGRCSPSMNLALVSLDQATNWNDARSRLQQVHQIAYDDLPVIPLWQTQKFFATQQALEGVGKSPVSLYQNVSQWQNSFEPRDR